MSREVGKNSPIRSRAGARIKDRLFPQKCHVVARAVNEPVDFNRIVSDVIEDEVVSPWEIPQPGHDVVAGDAHIRIVGEQACLCVERLQGVIDDLPLFAAAAKAEEKEDAALQALDDVDPDALSPRQALEALYRLKGLRRDGEAGCKS